MKARERHMWSQPPLMDVRGAFNKQSELRGPMDIMIKRDVDPTICPLMFQDWYKNTPKISEYNTVLYQSLAYFDHCC